MPELLEFFSYSFIILSFYFYWDNSRELFVSKFGKKLALRKWEMTYFICSSWDNLSEGDKVSAKRNPSHKKSTTPYDPNAYVVKGPKAAMITAKRKDLHGMN